jgi:hypothetical protein
MCRILKVHFRCQNAFHGFWFFAISKYVFIPCCLFYVAFSVLQHEWMNGWMNEWMKEWMDEWMDGWMHGCMPKTRETFRALYMEKQAEISRNMWKYSRPYFDMLKQRKQNQKPLFRHPIFTRWRRYQKRIDILHNVWFINICSSLAWWVLAFKFHSNSFTPTTLLGMLNTECSLLTRTLRTRAKLDKHCNPKM